MKYAVFGAYKYPDIVLDDSRKPSKMYISNIFNYAMRRICALMRSRLFVCLVSIRQLIRLNGGLNLICNTLIKIGLMAEGYDEAWRVGEGRLS